MTRVIIGHLLLLFLIHNVNSFTHPLVGVRRHKNIAFSLLAKGSPDNSGSETEASIRSISKEAESLMARSVQSVKGSLQTVRTGRASPSILDRVVVSYYGAPTPLSQLATISVPSAQQLQGEFLFLLFVFVFVQLFSFCLLVKHVSASTPRSALSLLLASAV